VIGLVVDATLAVVDAPDALWQRIGFLALGIFAFGPGSGLYIASAAPQPAPDSEVIQGMVEESNVQPIIELTEMIAVLRNFQAAQKMIDTQDEMQRRVINTVVASS